MMKSYTVVFVRCTRLILLAVVLGALPILTSSQQTLLFATTPFLNPTKAATEEGNQAFAEAAYETALTLYSNVKKKLPNNPKVLQNLATVLHKVGQYEEAEKYYQAAITEASTSTHSSSSLLLSQLYYNLGNHYLERSAYQKSIQAYRQSLSQNDKDIQTKKNLEIALGRIAEQAQNQQNLSTPQNEQTSGQPNQNPNNSRSSQAAQSKNKQPQPPSSSSKKSEDLLKQGLDQSTRQDPSDLPEEAQKSQVPQNPTSQQDFISRKRANEILESFEERYKNFQRLDHRTTPPKLSPRQNQW